MKRKVMTSLFSIFLLTGCAFTNNTISEDEGNIETIYGTISQNEDGAFLVTYENEEHQIIQSPIPSNTMILQNNASIEESDLSADESVIVSFANGTMKVIQVINAS